MITVELHLLEYHEVYLEYLKGLESHPLLSHFQSASLKPFLMPYCAESGPESGLQGYDDKSISGEMISGLPNSVKRHAKLNLMNICKLSQVNGCNTSSKI
jgi:hypothetical protein